MKMSPTVVTTSGEIILPGSGGGVIIVDALSRQPIAIIGDASTENTVAVNLLLSPTGFIASENGEMQICDRRLPEYPIQYEAQASLDKQGHTRIRYVPRSQQGK